MLRFCAPHRRLAGLAVALAFASVTIDILVPLWVKALLDRLSIGDEAAAMGLAFLAIAAIVKFGVQFGQRSSASALAVRAQHDMRVALLCSLYRYSGQRQDSLNRGEIVSRSISDLQVVQSLILLAPQAVASIVQIAAQLSIMFYLAPPLAAATVLIIPIAWTAIVRYRRRLYVATWLSQEAAADLTTHIGEAIAGLPVTKTFGKEEILEERFEKLAEALFSQRRRVGRLNSVLSPSLTVLPQLSLVVVIGFGGLLVLSGRVSIGTFVAFATYLLSMIGLTRLLAGIVAAIAIARSSFDRISDITESPDDAPSAARWPVSRSVPDVSEWVRTDRPAVDVRADAVPGLGVRLSDVVLRLGPEEREVLRGVSLEIHPGKCLGVAGNAGSGKSVLGMVLQGQYRPDSGDVTFVDRDGGSISTTWSDPDVVLATEEPFLFSGTIRENILLGREFNEDRFASAITDAAVDLMFRYLPEQDRTYVGEGGIRLSGGERQRVALARALYNSPRLLILDEATSALDTLTEARVLHAMRGRIARGGTVVVTGRRRSVLSLADYIAVVESGQVVEYGEALDLLHHSARLASLMGVEPSSPTLGAETAVSDSPGQGAPAARERIRRVPRRPGGAGSSIVVEKHRVFGAAREGLTHSDVVDGRRRGPLELRDLLRPVRVLVFGAALCIGLEVAAAVSLPTIARIVLERASDKDASAVVFLFGLGLIVVVLSWAAGRGTIRKTTLACERMLFVVRLRCFRHMQRLPMAYVERVQSGSLLARMTTDIDSLSSFLQTGLPAFVVNLLLVVGVLTAIIIAMPESVVILAVPFALAAVGAWKFQRIVGLCYPQARELLSRVNADMYEKTLGVRTVQIYGCSEKFIGEFARKSAAYGRERQRGQRTVAWFFPLVAFMIDVSVLGLLLISGTGGVLCMSRCSSGSVAGLILYLSMLYYPIQQIATVYDGAQQSRVGWRRIGDLLAEAPEAAGEPAVTERRGSVPATAGDIHLEDVRFKYREDAAYSLAAVSLSVRSGTSVAIVGPTGAGKSTIIKLLARFYRPQSGRITVGGADVDDISLRDYRKAIALVPQEAHLFSGTVRENIAFGRPGVSSAEIQRVVGCFGATEMMNSLPGGLDYDVGPRGTGLSAGQKQVVALLRAVVSAPDLLLLDEATAALDLEAERSIVGALRNEASGRKTVLVAHRLATASRADVIVVVADGRVVETGVHDALLRAGGLYASLWAAGNTQSSSTQRVGELLPTTKGIT